MLHLPPLLSFTLWDYILYAHIAYSLKTFKEGKFCEVNLKAIQNFFVIFFSFFDSTLNSMSLVRCSTTVSEWLKMRKSLGIYYYQDTISGVEVYNNVININKIWEVSPSFVILLFLTSTLFFSIMKNRV